MVRLAVTLALPTDEELEHAGSEDAGEFVLMLRGSPAEFKEFVEFNSRDEHIPAFGNRGWDQLPRQRVGRCIDHLIAVIARVMEMGASGSDDDLVVTYEEARSFLNMKQRQAATPAAMRRGSSRRLAEGTAAILTTVKNVASLHRTAVQLRERLLTTLSQVDILKSLDEQQLILLRDSLQDARYTKGQYIFAQGDLGDRLYIVMDGEVEIVREDTEDHTEKFLATLKQFAVFGERALLNNTPRFASARAATPIVRCAPCRRLHSNRPSASRSLQCYPKSQSSRKRTRRCRQQPM
jgi:hypothetical protein